MPLRSSTLIPTVVGIYGLHYFCNQYTVLTLCSHIRVCSLSALNLQLPGKLSSILFFICLKSVKCGHIRLCGRQWGLGQKARPLSTYTQASPSPSSRIFPSMSLEVPSGQPRGSSSSYQVWIMTNRYPLLSNINPGLGIWYFRS